MLWKKKKTMDLCKKSGVFLDLLLLILKLLLLLFIWDKNHILTYSKLMYVKSRNGLIYGGILMLF